MCYNFIDLETTEFVVKQVHPAGKALTSDWSATCFIMVIYEKKIKSHFGQKHLTDII